MQLKTNQPTLSGWEGAYLPILYPADRVRDKRELLGFSCENVKISESNELIFNLLSVNFALSFWIIKHFLLTN